jgi:hypothetical protein
MGYDSTGPGGFLTLYVNRRLRIPPLTAQAAFDAHLEGAPIRSSRSRCVADTASGELQIDRAFITNGSDPRFTLRQAPGHLVRGPGLARIAIEVEVTAWSDSCCEIGIRPRSRLIPLAEGRRQNRYLQFAAMAADELALRLETVVNTWLKTQFLETEDRHPRGPVHSGQS